MGINEKLKLDFDAMEKERDELENGLQRILPRVEEDQKKDITDVKKNIAVENGKEIVWKTLDEAENRLLSCQLQIEKQNKEISNNSRKSAIPLSPFDVNSDTAQMETSTSKVMSGSKQSSSSKNVIDLAISSLRSFDEAINTLRSSETS